MSVTYQNRIHHTVNIGDFSIVNNATIGMRTKIWNHVNIYGCEIGIDCVIGGMTEIQSDVTIGDRTHISSHTFICSKVEIGNDCQIAHNVTFTNDRFREGIVHYEKQDWEHTTIGDNVKIGSGATILPVTIGEGAVIGAGSVVTKDIPAYSVSYGNPATVKYFLKDKL